MSDGFGSSTLGTGLNKVSDEFVKAWPVETPFNHLNSFFDSGVSCESVVVVGLDDEVSGVVGVGNVESVVVEELALIVGGEPGLVDAVGPRGEVVELLLGDLIGGEALVDLVVNYCGVKEEISEQMFRLEKALESMGLVVWVFLSPWRDVAAAGKDVDLLG